MRTADPDSPTRKKLLDAARDLMRLNGYAATSVTDVCRRAGVTNGSFFHFFPDKEELARAAVSRFIARELEGAARSAFRKDPVPLNRLLGWIDAAVAVFENPGLPKSCLLGTLTQELAPGHRRFQSLFDELFARWSAAFAEDAAAALAARSPRPRVTAEELADLYLAVIQGSIILVKARGNAAIGARNLRGLRGHVSTLFSGGAKRPGRNVS